MAARMNTWRDHNVGVTSSNVYAWAGPIRGRAHIRVFGPFVNELITLRCDVGQTIRDRPVFIFQPLHCGGIIYIHNKETGVRPRNGSPVASAELPEPRLNLLRIGCGMAMPAGQVRQLGAGFKGMQTPAPRDCGAYLRRELVLR